MMCYALLLETGALVPAPSQRGIRTARKNAKRWNEHRRAMIADGAIVTPRLCVALVKITEKP